MEGRKAVIFRYSSGMMVIGNVSKDLDMLALINKQEAVQAEDVFIVAVQGKDSNNALQIAFGDFFIFKDKNSGHISTHGLVSAYPVEGDTRDKYWQMIEQIAEAERLAGAGLVMAGPGGMNAAHKMASELKGIKSGGLGRPMGKRGGH